MATSQTSAEACNTISGYELTALTVASEITTAHLCWYLRGLYYPDSPRRRRTSETGMVSRFSGYTSSTVAT